MIYDCAHCNRKLVSNRDEALETGEFPPVVSYVGLQIEGDKLFVCADCLEREKHSRKFNEYGSDRSELAKCLILYALLVRGSADDATYSEGFGYLARFGRFLLTEGDDGSVYFREFQNAEKAERDYDSLYDEGYGAQEDDAYISDDYGRKPYISFAGKQLDIWSHRRDYPYDEGITLRRCIARVRLEAMRTGFYPNLWLCSERGNLQRQNY